LLSCAGSSRLFRFPGSVIRVSCVFSVFTEEASSKDFSASVPNPNDCIEGVPLFGSVSSIVLVREFVVVLDPSTLANGRER
jgi:hypothetical protein